MWRSVLGNSEEWAIIGSDTYYTYKRSSSSRVNSGFCTFRPLTGSFTMPCHPSFQSSAIRSLVFVDAVPGNSERRSSSFSTSNTAAFNVEASRPLWNGDEGPSFFWSFAVAFRRSLGLKSIRRNPTEVGGCTYLDRSDFSMSSSSLLWSSPCSCFFESLFIRSANVLIPSKHTSTCTSGPCISSLY